MVKALALILLTGMSFAQSKPKPGKPVSKPAVVKPVAPPPVETKADAKPPALPEISADYQSQFKTIVIRQKDIQIDELQLQARYLDDTKATDRANAEGQVIETKLLQELKLDPKKYTTVYQGDKMVIVEKK